VGLVQGQHLSVDGSFVEANAAKESRVPREQLGEAAQVHHTVRQYLQELEQQNPVEEPVHEQDQVSTTDPDSTYATKGGTPARLGYYQPEHNRYICPAGQVLNYGGRNLRNRTYAYIGTRKRCGGCALKTQCTSGAFRFLAIHMDEAARQRARELAHTPEFAQAQRREKESGSVVRGTQASDRAAPPPPTEIEVRARTVLPGSRSPEHQATHALPQSADNSYCRSYHLAEMTGKLEGAIATKKTFR
jgi:hypothetical protein